MICKPIINLGPRIGSVQPASERICKALQNVGPVVGITEPIGPILYGSANKVSYGTTGEIIY